MDPARSESTIRGLVRAEGRLGRQTIVREFLLSSQSEARVTGLVAAETARMLVDGKRRAGVLHLEPLASPRARAGAGSRRRAQYDAAAVAAAARLLKWST